jgi:hypothetical protein
MKRRSLGLSLLELLLILGVVAAGSTAVYGTYQFVVGQHRQDVAVRQAQDTIGRVTTAFSATPNYEGLTQERAIEDGLFGPDVVIEEGRALAPWGGELFLAAVPAQLGPGQIVQNGAFSFTLNQVPASLCSSLASSLSNTQAQLSINQKPIAKDADGTASIAALTQACSSSPTSSLVLTFKKPNASDALQECLVPSDGQRRSVPCGDGLAGTREEERQASCPQRYGNVQWTAWQETSNSCITCPSPESQTIGCGPNQYGTRQQQRTFDCAQNRWNDWTTSSDTCQACPNTPEERTVACEAGNSGTIVERRTFACLIGQWGPWQVYERHCQR